MLEDTLGAHRFRRPRGRRRRAQALVATACAVAGGLVLAAQGGASGQAARLTVHPGDTLWAIAAARYPGDDLQARVAAIEAANHLSSAALSPGEVLVLPPR